MNPNAILRKIRLKQTIPSLLITHRYKLFIHVRCHTELSEPFSLHPLKKPDEFIGRSFDKSLASCSCCESYRHQLKISKSQFVPRSKSWSLGVLIQEQQAVASRLSPGRCVRREWVRAVLFFTEASLNASHMTHLAAAQYIKYHQANTSNNTLFTPFILNLYIDS